ncbi:MAG: hypothetical protein AB7V50_02885 [Vampirovibrionia bacterium]
MTNISSINSLNTLQLNNNLKTKTINKTSDNDRNYQSFSGVDKSLASYNKAFISFKGNEKPELNNEFFKDLTSDQKQLDKKLSDLRNNIGFDFRNWLETEYKNAFEEYTKDLYDNAQSIEELIAFRPDWLGSRLEDKFNSLHPDKALTIGQLPESFVNENVFNKLAETLFHIVEISNPQYPIEKTTLEIDGNVFDVSPLKRGATTETPFIITTPDNKKYVLKIDTDKDNTLNGLDKVGLQAVIDYYLTANDCKNVAKMHYYNHQYNLSINEFIEKNPENEEIKGKEVDTLFIHKNLPDLVALNVKYNDIMGNGNIIKQDDRYVMIDSGHCTFDSKLKPVVVGYNKKLPNSFDNQAKVMAAMGLQHLAGHMTMRRF